MGYSITMEVTWDWFHCKTTQKCIHVSSRCDMHPNVECIYEKDGVMLSEDEEDCYKEYKRKGLIRRSASFECPSLDHNKMSLAIQATVLNSSNGDYDSHYEYHVTVIPAGVVVQIQTTRCDGKIECWNGEDEEMCGYNTFVTLGAGNLLAFLSLIHLIYFQLHTYKYFF